MLHDDDRAILNLAAQHPEGGPKLTKAAREQLGLQPTRFYQRLDQIVRTRAAIEQDAMTCALWRGRSDGS